MKTLLRCSVALLPLLAGTGLTQAADLINSEPAPYSPPPADAKPWQGFYVGVLGGYFDTHVQGAPGNQSNASLGVYGGYNYQFDNNIVIGAEADYSYAFGDYKGFEYNLSSFGSVRGRIGYAFDRTLIYGTGGLAIADFSSDVPGPSPDLDTGWAAGAGVEYLFPNNISAKAEYLYMDIQDSLNDVGAPPGTTTTIQSLRIGMGVNF